MSNKMTTDDALVVAAYLRREAETTTDFRQETRCTDAANTIERLVEQVAAAKKLIDLLDAKHPVKFPGYSFRMARAAWDRVKP